MKKIKKYKDQKYCGRDSVLVCLDCHSKIPLPRWASGPITSWETDRETVETVSDFILGSSKITANGDCSHEIKRHLLLGRKVMTNLLLLLLLLSRFSHVRLLVTPWTAAHQAPLSMGFSRQEYWSGVPLPSPMTNLDSILKSRYVT